MNAANVNLSASIQALFSQSLDSASVTTSSITVADASEKSVGGTTTGTGATLTWTANVALTPNSSYVVTISGTVRGSFGATLGGSQSVAFNTSLRLLPFGSWGSAVPTAVIAMFLAAMSVGYWAGAGGGSVAAGGDPHCGSAHGGGAAHLRSLRRCRALADHCCFAARSCYARLCCHGVLLAIPPALFAAATAALPMVASLPRVTREAARRERRDLRERHAAADREGRPRRTRPPLAAARLPKLQGCIAALALLPRAWSDVPSLTHDYAPADTLWRQKL
jgi:hypothetical protein